MKFHILLWNIFYLKQAWSPKQKSFKFYIYGYNNTDTHTNLHIFFSNYCTLWAYFLIHYLPNLKYLSNDSPMITEKGICYAHTFICLFCLVTVVAGLGLSLRYTSRSREWNWRILLMYLALYVTWGRRE
jgi:hypothetical protein